MKKQIYYEDVAVGDAIPALHKTPTTRQLVMWAGASGDYNPIHYDKDFALERGLPGVVVHGQLAGCCLGQMITDWIGEKGTLKTLNINYTGMNLPGNSLTCRGTVVKKYAEEGDCYVKADLWTENPDGEKTLTGTATVALPCKPV